MLTVYIVLLFAVPSNLQWTALGSLGKPATLWGLVLLLWWVLSQLRPRGDTRGTPVRAVPMLFVLFCVVVLVSFASAMLRGQPADQIGSAMTSLVRVASWAGVLLVVSDGIHTRNELVTLMRRLSISVAILASLGAVQIFVGSTLLEWTGSIPGWQIEWGSMDPRGGMFRPVGTATHPLEFSSTLTVLLPVTIAYAAIRMRGADRAGWRWVLPPLLALALLSMTMTRSAVIGVAVGLTMLLPSLPSGFRKRMLVAIALGGVAIAVAFPRVVLTTLGTFTGVSDDPSAQSRLSGLSRVPEFASSSPLIGAGWGTFFPRYYIFDNAWMLTLIEAGVLGVVVFGAMMITGFVNAARAARRAAYADRRVIAGSFAASLAAATVVLALFDGLSFGMFAGTLFLLLGLATAAWTLAQSDEPVTSAPDALVRGSSAR